VYRIVVSYSNVLMYCYIRLIVIDQIRRQCLYNGSAPYWLPSNVTISLLCPEGEPIISERVAELGSNVSE